MNRRILLPIFASAALSACGIEDPGAQVLVPEQIGVQWDESFNQADDGIGAILPIDVLVYNGATGEPLVAVPVSIRTPSFDTDRIDSISLIKPSSLEILPPDCRDCVWDSGRDRYVDFLPSHEESSTDEDGLARLYVWVDAFPNFNHLDGFQDIEIEIVAEDTLAQIEIYAD